MVTKQIRVEPGAECKSQITCVISEVIQHGFTPTRFSNYAPAREGIYSLTGKLNNVQKHGIELCEKEQN